MSAWGSNLLVVNSDTSLEEIFDYNHIPGQAVLHRGLNLCRVLGASFLKAQDPHIISEQSTCPWLPVITEVGCSWLSIDLSVPVWVLNHFLHVSLQFSSITWSFDIVSRCWSFV